MRVDAPAGFSATSELAAAVASVGGEITALDVIESAHETLVVDITCNTSGEEHAPAGRGRAQRAGRRLGAQGQRPHLPDAPGRQAAGRAQGRSCGIGTTSPGPTRPASPGSAWRSPRNPADARRLTIKRNTVAVVTDGTAVLGSGRHRSRRRDAGDGGQGRAVQAVRRRRRLAGLPGHQGHRGDHLASSRSSRPVYGGVNLEDIAAPRCFEIERRLRDGAGHPRLPR